MKHFTDIKCPVCGYESHLYCGQSRKSPIWKSCRDHLVSKHRITRQEDIDRSLELMLIGAGGYKHCITFDSAAPPDWPSEFVLVDGEV